MMDLQHSSRRAFLLKPLDTLFCRDGRPFGSSVMVSGGLPQPQTVAGALRTRALRRHGVCPPVRGPGHGDLPPLVRGMSVRGPWLAWIDADGRPTILLPAPADIVQPAKGASGKLARLGVLRTPPPGWETRSGYPPFPLWLTHDASSGIDARDDDQQFEPLRGFVTLGGMERYLDGDTPEEHEVVPERPRRTDNGAHGGLPRSVNGLYVHEPRVGIQVSINERAATQSQLYSVRMLRLARQVSLYIEVDVPKEVEEECDKVFPVGGWTVLLGGEGKVVQASRCEPVSWPRRSDTRDRVLVVLISPALFPTPPCSVPTSPPGWKLVAAAVPGFVPVSGWDLRRGQPKPTRHFVPAGSVYCFERDTSSAKPLPNRLGEVGDPLDGSANVIPQGYGVSLQGAWSNG
ncbi:MAG: hypothetical protein IT439_04050 [Phycisphaerales bacterium]|nr:hypothetical protein [Phycisphaerales bacterium]